MIKRRQASTGAIPEAPTIQSITLGGRRINQSAIARAQGLDQAYVSRILSGKKIPTIPTALKIAAALGMGLEELLDAIDERKRDMGSAVATNAQLLSKRSDKEGTPHNEHFNTIKDARLACVERGKVIFKLVQSGIFQTKIADRTHLSRSMISHLKTCFLNLRGTARQMCKTGRMNGDACYLLASTADVDQERCLRRAIEIARGRDLERPHQDMGPRGRQSPQGQITVGDIREAIRAERL